MRTWIKDPVAILAADSNGGAERGIVVEDGRIVELVGKGSEPEAPVDAIFDAGRHVVLPGLVNTHHHFFQTLTRAHPDAINKELFPWLQALYPIWSRLTPEAFRQATRLALTELMMSGCTAASDHHYLFPDGLESAMDIQVEEATALGMRMTVTRGLDEPLGQGRRPAARLRRAGRGHDFGRLRAGAVALPRSERGWADPRGARPVCAVHRHQAADDGFGRACRALSTAACTPTSARHTTRTPTASNISAAVRWTISRSSAG